MLLILFTVVIHAAAAEARSSAADLAQSQPPALKIVVIAGEDAVNIIQQKTAVAPVVEVRDRNDLPVPGALVTFAVNGGTVASFGNGASTFTIATNGAGRATAAALTPIGRGAVQIQVTAAFQGQTAAATIAQTNVMTAAEAAAASASGGGSGGAGAASGGAAGGGGGLSGTTLGIIAGGIGGGVFAATQASKGDSGGGTSTGGGTSALSASGTVQQYQGTWNWGGLNGTVTVTVRLNGPGQ